MSSPLVSIIVTCYNRADMVARALDSVYAQTYRPLELIIVDDGSKDNSMEVINAWKAAHPDGNGFTCKAQTFPNGKLCVARNRGIEMSAGEFIQYVDDDDWLYPFAVEEKIKAFEERPDRDIMLNQVDYCFTEIGICGHSHLTVAEDDTKQLEHILNTKTETYFSPTLMFRRKILLDCGVWTPGLVFADDVDIIIRAALCNAKFGLMNKSLSVYNMHGEIRQCNNMIHKLPDDFWSSLFLKLYEISKEKKKDTSQVRRLLGEQLEMYSIRLLREGKYHAAELGLKAAYSINGLKNIRLQMPKLLRYSEYCLEHTFFSAWNLLKKIAKKVLRKSK